MDVKGKKIIVLGDFAGVAKEVSEALEREKMRVFITHDVSKTTERDKLDAVWGCDLIPPTGARAKRKTLHTFGAVDHVVFFDDGHVLPRENRSADFLTSVANLVTRVVHELAPKHSVLLLMNESPSNVMDQSSDFRSAMSDQVLKFAKAHAPLRVNWIETNLLTHAIYCKLPVVARKLALKNIAEALPLKKKFSTHYLTDAVMFLLASDYITNACLPVDGGQSLT